MDRYVEIFRDLKLSSYADLLLLHKFVRFIETLRELQTLFRRNAKFSSFLRFIYNHARRYNTNRNALKYNIRNRARTIQWIATRVSSVSECNRERIEKSFTTLVCHECFPRDMRHYGVYYAFISRSELAYAPVLPYVMTRQLRVRWYLRIRLLLTRKVFTTRNCRYAS